MSDNIINNDIPTPNLVTPSLKHYLQQADWTFSRLLGFMLKALIFVFLTTLSLTTLYFELLNIFEHQDGLGDISTIELIFFFSFFVLLKRYWAYSKQTSQRWWHLASTPFLWHGKLIVAFILFASAMAFFELEQGTNNLQAMIDLQTMMLATQHYGQLVSLITILLCLYISLPSRSLIVNIENTSPLETQINTDNIKQENTNAEVENAQ
ncbi:hypothetical protein [Vibrio alfacsensis]|uniref:hypothetical protein n=1 Tax=Vibrio alfacsensis TaxID=1074311 RepID=UPI0040681945